MSDPTRETVSRPLAVELLDLLPNDGSWIFRHCDVVEFVIGQIARTSIERGQIPDFVEDADLYPETPWATQLYMATLPRQPEEFFSLDDAWNTFWADFDRDVLHEGLACDDGECGFAETIKEMLWYDVENWGMTHLVDFKSDAFHRFVRQWKENIRLALSRCVDSLGR